MSPSLFLRLRTIAILAGALLVIESVGAAASAPLKFDFGSGAGVPEAVQVSPDMLFTKERGFGFEPGATVAQTGRGIVSDQPFYFSARVPQEGNYRVSVTLGDEKTATTTTIKAELRRLMVEKISTAPGKFETVSFVVNTRVPQIAATGDIRAGIVRLKTPRKPRRRRAPGTT